MAVIEDVTKLKPELQGISDSELTRRMNELQMEADRRLAAKDEEKRKAEVALKNTVIARYLEVLAEMKGFELLPDEILAFYTNKGGTFTPHLKHKQIKV